MGVGVGWVGESQSVANDAERYTNEAVIKPYSNKVTEQTILYSKTPFTETSTLLLSHRVSLPAPLYS